MVFLQLRLREQVQPLLHMPDIDWPGWKIAAPRANAVRCRKSL
jgi:hypothetical protein